MNDGFEGSGFVASQGGGNQGGGSSYGGEQRQGSSYSGNGGGYQQRGNGGYQGGGQGGGYRGNNGGGNSYGGNRGGYQGGGGNRGNFQRKQEPEGPAEFYLPYTVTANREIPQEPMNIIIDLIKELEGRGYTMRTAGREGPEDTFDKTATKKEIHLPWRGFMDKESKFSFTSENAKVLAGQLTPSFEGMKPGLQTILASDVKTILGKELRSPTLFLITWSEDGAETMQEKTSRTGNVGLAIALACKLKIPIFNLGKPNSLQRLRQYLGNQTNEQKQESPVPAVTGNSSGNYQQGSNYGKY